MSDLISRQAAIKAIEDLQDCYNGFSDTYDKACIIGVIEEVPSIEPVKHGRWIPCTKSGMPLTEFGRKQGEKWYGYKCSECNDIYKGNALLESPWCRKCGARMDGGEK